MPLQCDYIYLLKKNIFQLSKTTLKIMKKRWIVVDNYFYNQ